MTTPQNQPPNHPWPPQQHQVWPPANQQWPPQQPAPQKPKKKRGKWFLIAGGIVLVIIIAAGLSGGGDQQQGTASTAAAPSATPASATAEPAEAAPQTQQSAEPADSGSSYDGYGQTEAAYGDQVPAGDLTVSAAKPKTLSQQFLGKQVCAKVSYKNTGTSKQSFNLFDWKFRTASGVEASANIPFNAGDQALNSGDLAPGGSTSGMVCGDSQTTNVVAVIYNPGFGVMHEVTFE